MSAYEIGQYIGQQAVQLAGGLLLILNVLIWIKAYLGIIKRPRLIDLFNLEYEPKRKTN